MSYITNFYARHKLRCKRIMWFVGLYFASLILIGAFYYAGHWFTSLLP